MTSKAGERLCNFKTLIDDRDLITVGTKNKIQAIAAPGGSTYFDFLAEDNALSSAINDLGFVYFVQIAGYRHSDIYAIDSYFIIGGIRHMFAGLSFGSSFYFSMHEIYIYKPFPFEFGVELYNNNQSAEVGFNCTFQFIGISRETYLEYLHDRYSDSEENDSSIVKLPD